jgi:autotransporter-associated beta strand protein
VAVTAGNIFLTNGAVTFVGASAVSATSITVDSTASLIGSAANIMKAGTTLVTNNGTWDCSVGGPAGGHFTQLYGSGILKGGLRFSGGTFSGSIVDTVFGVTRNGVNWNGGTVNAPLALSGDNSGATGDFLIASTGAILSLQSANAISAQSYLRLEGAVGYVELAYGDLTRVLTGTASGGGGLSWAVNNSGFYAKGADRTLTLVFSLVNTTPVSVTWGNNGISANPIQLGHANDNAKIIWSNDINLNGARTINVVHGAAAVDAELSGSLSGSSSSLSLTGNGVINLSGSSETYASGTTVNGPTVNFINSIPTAGAVLVTNGTLNVTPAWSSSGAITVNNGGKLNINGGWTPTAGNVTVGAGGLLDVSQSGGVTLAASQTLSGAGAVTGAVTTVSSDVVSGTLAVRGNLTLASGASLIPGANGTAGTLSVSNQLTLSGQILQFDLSTNLVEGGGTNDEIIVGGNLVLNGGEKLLLNYLNGSLPAGTYKIIKYGGTLTGTFSLLAAYPNVTVDNGVGTPGYITLVVSAPSIVKNLFWKGDGSANLWDFSTANWVTNFANPALAYSDTSFVTFNDFGSNNVPVTLNSTVYPNAVTFNVTNKPYTLIGSGKISGAVGVTINGGNALTNGLANDYTGGTVINGASTLVLLNGSAPGSGSVQLNAATGAVIGNNSGALNLPNRIWGNAVNPTFVQNGSGTTTLANTADNSGLAAKVNAGTLQLAAASSGSIHALGGNSTINSGGTLQLGGTGGDQIYTAVSVTNLGGTFDTAGNAEQFNTLTGYGSVIGGGTISLGGILGLNNSGTLAVTNTTITITTASAQWLQSPGSVIFEGGSLNLPVNAWAGLGAAGNQNILFDGGITTAGSGETIFGEETESSVVTFGPNANAVVWYWSYRDAFTNTFWYNGGNLTVNRFNYRGANNGAAQSIHYFNGTTLTPRASISPGFLNAGDGTRVKFYISTNGLIINDVGFNLGISPILAHDPALGANLDGGLTKSGSGVLSLTATNTFNGSVTVNGGTLQLNNVGAYNNVTFADNTTYQVSVAQAGASLTNNSLTLGTTGGGTQNIIFALGTLGIPSQPVVQVNNILTNSGPVVLAITAPFLSTGIAPLIKYGSMNAANFAATWSIATFPYVNLTLTNDTVNKVISVIINPGVTPKWNGNVSSAWDTTTLNWTSNAVPALYVETSPPGQPVTFDDTAVNFNVDISTATVNPLFVNVTNSTAYTFTGTLGIAGTGALIKNGAGSLTLSNASGANTYSGITTVSGGSIIAAQANVLSPNSAMTLNNSTLNIGTNNQTIGAVILNNTALIGNGTLNNGSLTFNNGATSSTLPPISGTLNLTQNGTGTLDMTNANTWGGELQVNAGTVRVNNVGSLGSGGFLTATMTIVGAGAALVFDGANGTSPEYIHLRGTGPTGDGALVVTNGNVTLNGGTVTVLDDNTTVNIGANASLTNVIPFSGFTLTKTGGGLLYFSGASAVNANAGITIAAGACSRVTVNSGGIFGGVGPATTVNVNSGGGLAPGNLGIGTLTVSDSLTNAGNITMEISYNGVTTNADRINVSTNLVFGGTLVVTNVGPNSLAAGQTFKLFNAPSYANGAFSSATLPALAPGLGWTNKVAIDGTIAVITTVSTTPFSLTTLVTGNQLVLSWPTDHTGWRLQVQTNSLSTGLNTNWVDVAGATTVSSVTNTIDSANGSVFYRMIYP